ncbi:lysM domain-containing protein [Ditylenchus destructor]|nr:lysM domain-containing protein [Ditylenchus destructor]
MRCGRDTTPGCKGLQETAGASLRVPLNWAESPPARPGFRRFGTGVRVLPQKRHRPRGALPTGAGEQVMTQRRPLGFTTIAAALAAGLFSASPLMAAGDYPITAQQRQTAQQVAQAGVPVSELAANAPDTYTVKSGDTLWAISGLFLKSPWRWPELWGMNTEQVRNPHLIYPGQVLVLVKSDGRARLQMGRDLSGNAGGTPGGTVKLSPKVRASSLYDGSIAPIPQHLIEPFLNEAVVLNTNELELAPRVVAAQENRVWMSKGDLAYAAATSIPS